MLSYGYIPRGYDQIWSARMTALRDACVGRAHELGMGLVAMKVVGAGILGAWSGYLVPGFDSQKLRKLPGAAIRHVLQDERVHLLTVGMRLRKRSMPTFKRSTPTQFTRPKIAVCWRNTAPGLTKAMPSSKCAWNDRGTAEPDRSYLKPANQPERDYTMSGKVKRVEQLGRREFIEKTAMAAALALGAAGGRSLPAATTSSASTISEPGTALPPLMQIGILLGTFGRGTLETRWMRVKPAAWIACK